MEASTEKGNHQHGYPSELQTVLQQIADDVVSGLNCVGAMVAPLEDGNTLPVRAYSVGFDRNVLETIQQKLGVSFLGPKSVAHLDDSRFAQNLCTRAVKGRNGKPERYVVSDRLYDLFRPVVNKPLSDFAQSVTGIKQVIAVPFFLEEEVVGNLFAASKEQFSQQDIDFLIALGRQAAIAIQSRRRLAGIQVLERVVLAVQASMTDETQVLQIIVDAVVNELDYVGAMVATLEPGNRLPVRAYSVSVAQELVKEWEKRLGVSFISPKAVAYLDDDRFQQNLSYRAVKGLNGRPEKFVASDDLYDLFRPVVNKPLALVAQKVMGIKQVIAVPFFLGDEVVGNLFVASRRPRFSKRETDILTILAQQAAVGIRNARIYRQSEERRQVAQVFAQMAFNSTVHVHTLRNHIGAFKMFAQLMQPQIADENFKALGNEISERLTKAADLLDNLHEPWREQPESPSDVNTCLKRAIGKIVPDLDAINARESIKLHLDLAEALPPLITTPDMLTEAFRIIINNAFQAVREKTKNSRNAGNLWIESRLLDRSTIQVVIKDDGIGIRSEHLDKIFEMRWSTKEVGMGFGLFWTKEYIEGLAGSIRVDSEREKGTIFRIRLPISS